METRSAHPPLPALTGLRAVAALLVVAHHLATVWRPGLTPPGPATDLLRAGYQGVGFFFVLSGFILAYGEQERRGAGAFYAARLARVMPAYLLGLALALPAFLAAPAAPGTRAAAAILALLGVQAWVAGPALMLWDAPGWSLSCELAFYLAFPPAARRARRLTARRLLAAGGALWLLSLAVPLGYLVLCAAGVLPYVARPGLAFSALPRLPEFLLGVALGRLYLLRRPGPPPAPLALPGLLTLGAGALIGSAHLPGPLTATGLLAPLWAAIVWHGARREAQGLLATGPLVLLGEISYGVYILHWPLWDWWTALRGVPGVVRVAPNLADGRLAAAYAAVVLIVALLSFRLIETPARRRLLHPRPPAPGPLRRHGRPDPLRQPLP